MKKIIIILAVFIISLFMGCASQKSETEKIIDMNCTPPYSFRVGLYPLYGNIYISWYQISNSDSLTIAPIKITNLDSLKFKISYPEIAKRAGIEGIVLIEVRFNSIDEINYIKVLSSIGFGLEDSVLGAIKDFNFIFDDSQFIEDKTLLLIVDFSLETRQKELRIE